MSVQEVVPRDLQSWLGQLLHSFRSQYQALDIDERRFVSSLDNLSPLCQIELIWLQPPDTQYVIVSRFEDRKDLETTVHGPFPTYEALERLEAILQQPKWDRAVEKEPNNPFTVLGATNYREIIENAFVGIMRELSNLPFRKPPEKPMSWMKTMLTRKAFLWYIAGNLANQPPAELASEIIESARRQAEAARNIVPPVAPPAQPRHRIKAYGGYIFPTVWLGQAPRSTFREKVANFPRFSEKVYEGTYKGRTLVAEQDGYLAIAEADRVKATAFLNEIMAVRLIDKKTTYALREHEVGEAEIDPEGKNVTSKGLPSLSPRTEITNEMLRPGPWSFLLPREVILVDELAKWLSKAEKTTRDLEMSESLRFLLEAFTHFENSSYQEAFVLSWVVIEKDLFSRWKAYLKGEALPSYRRKKLEDANIWSIDTVIEGLSLTKQIPSEKYEELMALKRLRNTIIHEGDRVTESQAEQSLDLAREIVEEKMSLFSS